MARVFLLIIQLCAVYTAYAQTSLPVPRNLRQTYENGTRSIDGRPGKNYWQNTADYQMDIQYDPLSRYLNGIVAITYYNNSPDTLKEIWFKLYPNFYKKGTPRLTKIDLADEGEGLVVDKLEIVGKTSGAHPNQNGTNMTVSIAPLYPGKSIKFTINYHYTLNKGSHNRTGQIEQGAAFIAYFFPRIAVYDDIDGWNENPYLGPQEFYNDFCNFKVNISVPAGFVVWATGDLINCNEVLSNTVCQRLALAEKSDTVVNIITSADIAARAVTASKPTNTFRYSATNVTDFVFALSDHYVWKSTSVMVDSATARRTRVDAVFNPIHQDYYEVIDFARQTVYAMTYRFPRWPFPYPHITVFDGLDQMEYPMMVNDNPLENRTDAITLTNHEIFHTLFPFYMGTNETKYSWMDEGWATLGEWLISPMIDPSIVNDYGVKPYEKSAGKEIDKPLNTLTTQLSGEGMFLNSYPKPALGYLFVKDLLGDSLFLKALHFYIKEWNGKHPMPYDFFNAMNTGSGVDLNWFWQRWFFDDGYPDLAIEEVQRKGNNYKVMIRSKGSKPVPVDLVMHFADASTSTIHQSISAWINNDTMLTLQFAAERPVVKFTLGSTYIPDVNKSDNVYLMKAQK